MEPINRRKALEKTSILIGGMISSSVWMAVLNGCEAPKEAGWKPNFLTKEEIITLENLVDILIPITDTPGAKDALVHRFIDEMLFILPSSVPLDGTGGANI